MKILQLNMWGGRLGQSVVDLLKKERPDVVALQEVVSFPGGRSILFEDLGELQEKAEYAHSAFAPHFGLRIMKRQAQFGLATLSNIPLEKATDMFTSQVEYVDDFDFIDTDYNIRGLQHVAIAHNGEQLHVLNHHGHHIKTHKNGDEETMRQCKMIADYVSKLEGPVVLCGDFNLAPESESLEQINKILVNHAKEHGIVTTRTPLTHKTEVCDYIFTSPHLDVTDFQVLDDIVSDHKALTIEFDAGK